MSNDARRTRLVLLFTVLVLATYALVAVLEGGTTALYFALGLPTAGAGITALAGAAHGREDDEP